MTQRVLLVEGVTDSTLYRAFCRETGQKKIDVKPPTSVGAAVDSKTNAIHRLPVLLKQLDDASVSHLGLIVDADYEAEHGLGFHRTLEKVRASVAERGFLPETRLVTGGFVFAHPDGLPAVGLWIMPDNKHEGMLEDFIKSAIANSDQIGLHAIACRAVSKLQTPLFKSIHRSKAEVATWRSWQRMPGAPMESVVGDGLIDLSSPSCQSLGTWLGVVFP